MRVKINSIRGALFFLALALVLSGCTPAGPRALLKGKKYLDRGDIADAVAQLKRATTLLATNANAWNYYGVALQRAGQPDEAANAYQNAIKLDRDLIEAHFNLGSLALEQDRPDVAEAEFTAYTLRRPNEAPGWLKLAAAQLKAGDVLPAERSFSYVLKTLKTDEAEAYNGLGLASIKLSKPRDAAQFFTAALQSRANFAPALLNLATVNEQYLHDHKAALENYRNYVALSPRQAGYDEVKAIVAGLEQTDAAASVMAPAVVAKTSAPEARLKISTPPVQRLANASRPEPVVKYTPQNPPAPRPVMASNPPTQTVQVPPEPAIVTTPKTNPPAVAVVAHVTNVVATPEPLEVPMPESEKKTGFWHRVFNSSKTPSPAKPAYRNDKLTPIPVTGETEPATKSAEFNPVQEQPAAAKPATVVNFPRYTYTSPPRPAAGDRRAAEGAFTKARLAEQDEKWLDALQWYQIAAETDPAWFEAQYNTGVIAYRLRLYSLALPRYELALALDPGSTDARYNFALALKAADFLPDAANEFKKILAAKPDRAAEIHAHLALANLCAQSLHDTVQARQNYLKVLELQPENPQASDIRFWLSANPK